MLCSSGSGSLLWLLLQPMYDFGSTFFVLFVIAGVAVAVAVVVITEQHTVLTWLITATWKIKPCVLIELKMNIINYVSYKTANKFISTVKHRYTNTHITLRIQRGKCT